MLSYLLLCILVSTCRFVYIKQNVSLPKTPTMITVNGCTHIVKSSFISIIMGALVKCMCFAGTSLESSESMCLLDEPLPGPSSECSTPKKQKLPKEVARLRTKVCRLEKQKKCSKQFTTQDMRIEHIMSQLSSNLPDNTISFIETQIRMSK